MVVTVSCVDVANIENKKQDGDEHARLCNTQITFSLIYDKISQQTMAWCHSTPNS